MQLSSANRQWLADFLATHHRAPRVLHIGNIANNAYNNSKLLIEAGVDNDVLCYDYYHTMGCPEWEDADFSDTVADDLRRWKARVGGSNVAGSFAFAIRG